MHSSEHWDECPAGTLSDMVAVRQRRQKRAVVNRVVRASSVCLLFVAGLAAATVLLTGGPVAATEMTCDRAVKLFAAYSERSLSPALHEQVESHLTGCPHCRREYRGAFGQETSNSGGELPQLVGAALWSP